MKKILLFSIVAFPYIASAQGFLLNNGATIQVLGGATLRVSNGGIINQNSGTISNDGLLYLDHNFDQTAPAAYTGTGSSWLWFENGGVAQTINATAVPRLRVGNNNTLQLMSNMTVSTDIDLMNSGDIELGNFNLMAGNATINNYDANNYIITNGTGTLERTLNNGDNKQFPIGNNTYNPVTLTNTGAGDNFQARVTDDLLVSGTAGAAITQDGVNRTWHISESVAGGSISDITVEWEQAEELPMFDRNQAGVAHWNGSVWSGGILAAATNMGGTRWSRTRTGQTSFSPFAVEDDARPLSVTTPLTATVTKTSNICNGECAGTATVTPAGGTAPYTYLWSNGQTTQTTTGLCYGAYNVIVTDAVGSTRQVSYINIYQPSAISVVSAVNNKTCSVQGSISVVVSGGTGAKTLLWSTGSTSSSITGLVGNNYGLTVTDAAGCQKTFSYFVDDLCYSVSIADTDISTCTATCTGEAVANVTEGVAPYSYLWTNGATTSSVTGLCVGTHKVTVVDANNIKRVASTLISHNALSATAITTPTTCNGGCDGTASINAYGAQAPYTYAWTASTGSQTTQTATGLCYGHTM
jgi:hypothetical protein